MRFNARIKIFSIRLLISWQEVSWKSKKEVTHTITVYSLEKGISLIHRNKLLEAIKEGDNLLAQKVLNTKPQIRMI